MRSLKKLIPAILLAALAACSLRLPPATVAVPPAVVSAEALATASTTHTPIPVPDLAPVPTPVLISIDFQDVSQGWGIAASNGGAILRSVDGGATWLNATPPEAAGIGYSSRMSVLDASTAWLLIPNSDYLTGTLFHTIDGGLNWNSNPVPFGGGSLQFLDSTTGRVLADRGAGAGSNAVEIYQTQDAGLSWNSVFHNDPTQPGSSDSLPLSGIKNGIIFTDPVTGWVTGTRPVDGDVYLFVTHDGGSSWAQQTIPLPAGYDQYQYMPQVPVFFGNQGFLPLIIYLSNAEQTFYTTQDGGTTWLGDPQDANRVVAPGLFSFGDAIHAWCWDGGQNLYFTTDGAQTWSGMQASLDLSGRLAQLEFSTNGTGQFTGWALTSVDNAGGSQLYRTTDNGATWVPLIP